MFWFSLLDVFSEPAKSLLCRGSNEITLNLVFEYVAQDLAQHIGSTTMFSEAYIKVTLSRYSSPLVMQFEHLTNVLHNVNKVGVTMLAKQLTWLVIVHSSTLSLK